MLQMRTGSWVVGLILIYKPVNQQSVVEKIEYQLHTAEMCGLPHVGLWGGGCEVEPW